VYGRSLKCKGLSPTIYQMRFIFPCTSRVKSIVLETCKLFRVRAV